MREVLEPNTGGINMGDGAPVRTALYEEHLALGANVVDFHGFELPIWCSNNTE